MFLLVVHVNILNGYMWHMSFILPVSQLSLCTGQLWYSHMLIVLIT